MASLDGYRKARDRLQEQIFFGFYGSPLVQAMVGLNKRSEVRPSPSASPENLVMQKAPAEKYAALLRTGGFDEALTRAVLYVFADDRIFDQRCALALNVARHHLMHLSLAAFKALVRNQFFVLQLEREQAVNALAFLVPAMNARRELLKHVHMIVDAGGAPIAAERERLDRLSNVMAGPAEKKMTPVVANRAPSVRRTVRSANSAR
jgi:hypothetical protein